MKIWIVDDSKSAARNLQRAIRRALDGRVKRDDINSIEWNVDNDRDGMLTGKPTDRFCRHLEARLAPGDLVLIDVGLEGFDLGPYGGLEVFKQLLGSEQFQDQTGVFALVVFFVTGHLFENARVQEQLATLGLTGAVPPDRWLAQQGPTEVAQAIVAFLDGVSLSQTRVISVPPEVQARMLWSEFDHDCRGAYLGACRGTPAQQCLQEAWRCVQDEIFPTFIERLRQLETAGQTFFGAERQRLKEILKSPIPQFDRLRDVGIDIQFPDKSLVLDPSFGEKIPGARIAIIEDDQLLAKQLKGQLEQMDHTVVLVVTHDNQEDEKTLSQLVTDPAPLILRIKRNRVDVVLLDLKLCRSPEEGLQLLRAIKAANKGVKVIVLSAFSQDYISQAGELAADGYLVKDPSAQKLADTIRDARLRRRILVIDDEPANVVTGAFRQNLAQQCCAFSSTRPPMNLWAICEMANCVTTKAIKTGLSRGSIWSYWT